MQATTATLSSPIARPSMMALIPWQLWCVALGVTSRVIGVYWDISWHDSIGRDSFWSPPHVAIYGCGVLAGVSCLSLIASHTFGSARGSPDTARVLWLRAPLGAFVIGWGGIAMMTAAPFDDWWHGAYGLDTKVMSPPHAILFIGAAVVDLGALILMLAGRNNADGARRRAIDRMTVVTFGLLLAGINLLFIEYYYRSLQHSGLFYRTLSLVVPAVLATAAATAETRFARSGVTGVYTGLVISMILILPLFPATPMLGPVLTPVDRFIPPEFPLLLIAPALALDLLGPRLARLSSWRQALIGGVVFTGVMLAVQWPFASFLQTEYARNEFFGTHYHPFTVHPESYTARYLFNPIEKTGMRTVLNIALAFGVAVLSTRAGLAFGSWLVRIRR
jgi:hypothetical protein